jgi:hypothetical protein
VVGTYFILSLFLSPLFSAVPSDATAPVLILVGVMMMGESSKVEWHDMSQALPAFLTAILMPLTYDITNGMIFGLLSSLCFYFTTGKAVAHLKAMPCCSGRRPEYEEITDGGGDDQEAQGLLMETTTDGTDRDSTARMSSIEKARQALNGSERNVDYGAILY